MMKLQTDFKRSAGFTMLEMVISLAIMATLFVAVAQATRMALDSKKKIQEQIDDLSRVRDTLKIMERDVNLAFHYLDVEKEMIEAVKKASTNSSSSTTNSSATGSNPSGTNPSDPTSSTTSTTQSTTQPTDPNKNPGYILAKAFENNRNRKDPTTHFVGREAELFFVTSNVGRMNVDQYMADFIKVGYLLADCQRPGLAEQMSQTQKCLIRRSSSIVEGDVTKTTDGTVLLEGVSEFKLRYIGKGKPDWSDSWNSMTDPALKDTFPDAVEISITTEKTDGKSKKKVSMQIVAAVRFPNNKVTP
jgi:prepilin-type N-terminal cleavage/methylation domain-containing protein